MNRVSASDEFTIRPFESAVFESDVARAIFAETLADDKAVTPPPVTVSHPASDIAPLQPAIVAQTPVGGQTASGGKASNFILDGTSPQSTTVTPGQATTETDIHSQLGTAGDPTQPTIIHILPETTVGLSSLGPSGLQAIADALPLIDYLPDPAHPETYNELVLRSPGIGGYDLRAYLAAELSFGVDFEYRLDLGAINTSAVVTSALRLTDDDPEGYAADPDADLYTNYVLDTSLATFTLTLAGTPGTTASYANLNAYGNAHFGILGAGLYHDGTLDVGGDILNINNDFGHNTELFNELPGAPLADLDLEFLRGHISVPTLPNLAFNSGALGSSDAGGVYDVTSVTATGPQFATLTFDPVPLIPILGQINTGSEALIENYFVDAGFSWTLLTAQATIGLALTQTLSAQITHIGVAARVDEFDVGSQQYVAGTVIPGEYGDKLNLTFSTGDHYNTHIVEDYTISVHITSQLDLTPILSLNFGLLYFEAYINPILIDELRVGLQLFSKNVSFNITSFKIAPDLGFDIVLHAEIVTQVDTHLPVVGSEFSDNNTIGSDGNFHSSLDLAGNQYAIDGFAGDDIVNGNPSANAINGGADNDQLHGNGGADIIHGGSGWDEIDGGLGNDILLTDAGGTGIGQETLSGGDGNDSLYASAVPGVFSGDDGDDEINIAVARYGGQIVDGGSGDNRLTLSYGALKHGVNIDISDNATSGIILAAGMDADGTPITASSYANFSRIDLSGTDYNDVLIGSSANNYLIGGNGDDEIHGGDGFDYLHGGAGKDKLYGDGGGDSIYGAAGDDLIDGGAGDDFLHGGDGNDIMHLGAGHDGASGGNGDDYFDDDAENVDDTMFGNAGNDEIHGGGGHDTIGGGSGDDILYASTLGGTVTGDAGRDRLYASPGASLDGGLGSDTYYVDGSDIGVVITDNDVREEDDPFSERANDTLVLTGGTSHQAATPGAIVPVDAVKFTEDGTLYTFDGAVLGTYTGIENFNLTGSSGDDKWVVSSLGNNRLDGGEGNDYLDGGFFGSNTLIGGGGDDSIVAGDKDTIDGGGGEDTLYWRSSRTAQTISIGDPVSLLDPITGAGTLVGSSSLGHVITGIERLVMLDDQGIGNDRITGGGLNDTLRGGAGDDLLSGLAGNDTIVAGTGGDLVYGGDGNDTIDMTDMEVVAQTITYFTHYVGGFLITEPVPIATDKAYGGAGDDTITATNTASLIDGGSGDDTITISNGGDRGDFITEVEGGDGNDHITGSDQDELLVGGNDARRVPTGYRGAPTLSDTAGQDDDTIDGGGGNDEIWGGRGADTLFAGTGTDIVYGGTGNDTVTGDATDKLYGEAGDDHLTSLGGVGQILLDGGTGDDTALFDLTGMATAVNFALSATTLVYADLKLVDIEKLDVSLTDGADTATGGDEDDRIAGGAGADIIHGGKGNDDIIGYLLGLPNPADPGGDVLFGDEGDDYIEVNAAATVDGGIGTDTLVVRGMNASFASAVLAANGGSGSFGAITYTGIEALQYTADRAGPAVSIVTGDGNDVLKGTDLADTLIAGGGANQLFGYGGDDNLSVSLGGYTSYVDGGDGFDTVTLDLSAATQDLYIALDNGPGGGAPIGAFTPASLVNIERVIVTTGSGNDTVMGTFSDDVIYTGSGNDTVNSGSGTDYIDLGAGDDTLTDLGFATGTEHFFGGDGNDNIHIGSQRAIVDGGNGNDVILVTEFFYGIPALDTPDDISGGDGDDTISSNSLGTFHGGNGTDRIINDLSKAGALNLTLTPGAVINLGTNWSLDGFELYSLKFGGGDDTVTVDYGAHDLKGGAGDDTITIRVDSRADASYTIETDFFGEQTLVFANGMRVNGFEHVTIDVVNTPAIGVNDSATTSENVVRTVAVTANDIENDGGPKAVAMIAGMAVAAGQAVTLASGAIVTLNNDGTLTYDANHKFDYLQSAATAAASGGQSVATDSFSYTLVGGNSATVTMTINGVDGTGDQIRGGAGNDATNGTGGADYFDLSQGGNDSASGGNGDDAFFFGAALTGADHVDGGAGTNDQLAMQGDYAGANALVLGANTISGIEVITALAGFSYDITSNDGNVAAGQTLKVYGSTLGAGDSFTFNGSAETDGKFVMYGGLGADHFTGGAGDDGFYFGRDGRFNVVADHIDGGAGNNDQLALEGNYTVTISNGTVTNVEVISLLDGLATHSQYNITLADDWTAAGQTHTVYGVPVRDGFIVDASAETDGNIKVYGGLGGDTITTGAGNDWIMGAAGADTLNGGLGADTYVYTKASQSIGSSHDIIIGFDPTVDRIDLPTTVTGIDAAINVGNASAATLDADLTTALAGLNANHAITFTASGGDLANHIFEVIDTNGIAGYQAGQDMVIELQTPAGAITDTTPFI